jgi:hypothetical protein
MTTVLSHGGQQMILSQPVAAGESASQTGMQRSASQQLLIGQSEPEGPSLLIPVAATATATTIPSPLGALPHGMMLTGQGMMVEQVRKQYSVLGFACTCCECMGRACRFGSSSTDHQQQCCHCHTSIVCFCIAVFEPLNMF